MWLFFSAFLVVVGIFGLIVSAYVHVSSAHTFIQMENDEPITLSSRLIIGVAKHDYEKANDGGLVAGIHLITTHGAVFWVKGDEEEIRRWVFGR